MLVALRCLPYSLVWFRLCCAILFLLAAFISIFSAIALCILLWCGLLSDIFDGIIARRLGVATAKLRRFDSQTDLIFWLSVLFAVYHYNPGPIIRNLPLLVLFLLLELFIYIINFVRFGREGCTHAYSAKIFGLALSVGFTQILLSKDLYLFTFAMIAGIISQVDVILISLLLPYWMHDVPHFISAWRSRRLYSE